jgi:diguanylate cyclase (GGDEF)-like protein
MVLAMQRKKLLIVVEEANAELEAHQSHPTVMARLHGVYYHWDNVWFTHTGGRVDDERLLSQLVAARKAATRQGRDKGSRTSYFWLPELEAAVLVETLKATRQQTRNSILRSLDSAARQGKAIYEANHDELTGLWNRRQYERKVVERIEKTAGAGASAGTEPANATVELHAVMMSADIDHFKQVNDSYGHQYGDLVLHCFARRLEAAVNEFASRHHVVGWCGRPGGEEFSMFFLGQLDRERLAQIAIAVSGLGAGDPLPNNDEWPSLASQFGCDPLKLPGLGARKVTASVGVSTRVSVASLDQGAAEVFSRLAREADQGVYRAKQGGRNTHRFFDEIRYRHGLVIERHNATGIVSVDIGRSVGVRKGDEYLVYHPDFSGQLPMSIHDGRSTKILGTRPRVHSGRLAVFDAQEEIAFCRIVEEDPLDVTQVGCHLEAVPLGAISHLVGGRLVERTDLAQERLRNWARTASGEKNAAAIVVVAVADGEVLEEQLGTTGVNEALAALRGGLFAAFGRSALVERLDTWSYAAAVSRVESSTPAELAKDVIAAFSDTVDSEVRVAIGVAPVPKVYEQAEDWAKALSVDDVLQHALLALQLSKKRGHEYAVFSESSAIQLLYLSRTQSDYAAALTDYAALRKLGVYSAGLENQAGLCQMSISGSDYEATEQFFRTAVKLKPDEPVFHANLGILLSMMRRYDDAASEFADALEKGFNPDPVYLVDIGRAFIEVGKSGDVGMVNRGVSYLREALTRTDGVTEASLAVARRLLEEHDAR